MTDQLAQLAHLRDVHSSSALAMALRKLNSSFVRHLAEKEELRTQVIDLEHQRDEAWKQAQDAAEEVDALQDRIAALEGTNVPTPASSRRSSRVLVARKTSIRVSKAGLRSPSRLRSQRSSRSSVAMSPTLRTGNKEDIPPLPPLPNRMSIGAALSGRSSRTYLDSTGCYVRLETDSSVICSWHGGLHALYRDACDDPRATRVMRDAWDPSG